MKSYRAIVILFVMFFMAGVVRAEDISPAPEAQAESAGKTEPKQVCFNSQCYQVEIADTCITRAKGLQYRETLPEDRGMLFVFQSIGPRGFWMKDTPIPLDIIWLDDDKRVLAIEQNAPPCIRNPCPIYKPEVPTRFVLEVNAGQVEKLSLQLGDRLTFNWEPKPIFTRCQVGGR